MITKLKNWVIGLFALAAVYFKIKSSHSEAKLEKQRAEALALQTENLKAVQNKTLSAVAENQARRAETREALDQGRRNYFEEGK